MSKIFEIWKALKNILIHSSATLPKFNEREIWYCSIGINVGYEINGKNDLVERPVLVIKKYDNNMFFGLPLTTKQKDYSSRYPIEFDNIKQDVLLDQGRTFSTKRLNRRLRVMGYKEFDQIKESLKEFLKLDKVTAPRGGRRD